MKIMLMKLLQTFVLSVLLLSLYSCSPRTKTEISRSYPSFGKDEEVVILDINDEVPENAIEIGKLKATANGIGPVCGFESAAKKARKKARKVGGNLLKMTSYLSEYETDFLCETIVAQIYRVENKETIKKIKIYEDAVTDSTWKYAKLYVYRLNGYGALVGYDLYLGKDLLCRVKNNSIHEITIEKRGLNSLWARTESKKEIPIT
jgi:hypothetical protein